MKKLLLSFLILFCLQLAPANAQWVTIPDANFATKLQQLFPSCMNGNQMDTTCTDILSATNLSLNSLGISNLSGIEHFDNLYSLVCNYNNLTVLPTLPSTLSILSCSSNQLTSLPTLPISLTGLTCSSNQINSLPALPNSITQLFYLRSQAGGTAVHDLLCTTYPSTCLPIWQSAD